MEKKSSDRRRRLRVPVQSRIKHSFYQVLGTPVFEENSSVDLSSNGISFETAREYQKGALILRCGMWLFIHGPATVLSNGLWKILSGWWIF
jgi:hypothetical protein